MHAAYHWGHYLYYFLCHWNRLSWRHFLVFLWFSIKRVWCVCQGAGLGKRVCGSHGSERIGSTHLFLFWLASLFPSNLASWDIMCIQCIFWASLSPRLLLPDNKGLTAWSSSLNSDTGPDKLDLRQIKMSLFVKETPRVYCWGSQQWDLLRTSLNKLQEQNLGSWFGMSFRSYPEKNLCHFPEIPGDRWGQVGSLRRSGLTAEEKLPCEPHWEPSRERHR